jgi:predicted RNA-binding protein (virulence factor B family)
MNKKSAATPSSILDFADPNEYQDGQAVELVIKSQTDLGYKAIVNGKHWGVLYHNEVFKVLEKDLALVGYIKKLREDGKIDLTLYKAGHHGGDEAVPKILAMLMENNGFLPITDKSSPEEIYQEFGVSKKKFKIAVSGLYKDRMITLEENGIRLVKR